MKSFLAATLLIVCAAAVFAQMEVVYSENDPLYSVVIPKGWNSVEYKDYKVLEIYNNDESLVYSIYELDTALLYEAVQRVSREADTEFVNHKLGVVEDVENNGVVFHKISGTGTTAENETQHFEARLFRPGGNNYFMIYYSGLHSVVDYYKIEIDAMNNSISKRQSLN